MNNDMDFKSIDELYNRIKPALYSKVSEFSRMKKEYIKEEDIWNYLVENTWKKQKNLTLSEMVGDILELESDDIDSYVMKILESSKRKINMDEQDLL